ncbi:MAG: MarR family transcriptional regulator [Novosphingobium sp.]|nr:MarR family transcriptional regulator [Novosphingobium sp.]
MRRGGYGPGDYHRTGLRRSDPIETPRSLQRDISLKLTVVARQLRKSFDKRIEAVGVTRSRWTAIAVVASHPGATQRTIAETLDMSEAAAGRLVDRLCHEGLLERRAKADDKRARCVFVTSAARPILEQLGAIASEQEAKIFRGLTEAELVELDRLLGAIYSNIGA